MIPILKRPEEWNNPDL